MKMSSEEFIRYICTILFVIGVAILAITLGRQFGLWAAGAVLVVTGAAIGVPLWSKHFSLLAELRYAAESRPEQARKANEESPY